MVAVVGSSLLRICQTPIHMCQLCPHCATVTFIHYSATCTTTRLLLRTIVNLLLVYYYYTSYYLLYYYDCYDLPGGRISAAVSTAKVEVRTGPDVLHGRAPQPPKPHSQLVFEVFQQPPQALVAPPPAPPPHAVGLNVRQVHSVQHLHSLFERLRIPRPIIVGDIFLAAAVAARLLARPLAGLAVAQRDTGVAVGSGGGLLLRGLLGGKSTRPTVNARNACCCWAPPRHAVRAVGRAVGRAGGSGSGPVYVYTPAQHCTLLKMAMHRDLRSTALHSTVCTLRETVLLHGESARMHARCCVWQGPQIVARMRARYVARTRALRVVHARTRSVLCCAHESHVRTRARCYVALMSLMHACVLGVVFRGFEYLRACVLGVVCCRGLK